MKRIWILSVCALLTCSAMAWALSSTIHAPEIGFPEGVPAKQADSVLKFLEEKAEFKNGMFINEYTQCSFSGPTSVISDLVEILSSQGQLSVTIGFARMKDKNIAFTTGQHDNKSISVVVNLDYKGIALDKLTMTVGQSPRAYSNKAARGLSGHTQE